MQTGGEKLAIKILIEDGEFDELSSQNNKNDCPPSKAALNLYEPGLCEICFANNEKIQVGACLHSFCRECLKEYVENLISIGKVKIPAIFFVFFHVLFKYQFFFF